MRLLRVLSKQFSYITDDDKFLDILKRLENLVSKVLAIAMVVVTIVATFDLLIYLVNQLFTSNHSVFTSTLITVFGLFLNILIALEILENITAYLRKHVVQVELVVVTSLTAVARKIIILDKDTSPDLTGLALAILALSISYWIVRHVNKKTNSET